MFTHISMDKACDREQTTGNNPTCHNTMLQWYLPSALPILHTVGAKARHYYPRASSYGIMYAAIYNAL